MFGLIDKLKKNVLNKYLGSATRTALAALVGLLSASTVPGVAEIGDSLKDQLPVLQEGAVAALGYLLIQVWSWTQKAKS